MRCVIGNNFLTGLFWWRSGPSKSRIFYRKLYRAMPSLCVNALGLYWPRPVSARLSVVSLNSVFSLAKYGEFWCILDGIFYSSATCFTRKTGVQPLYAYKSRDGE